MRFSFTPYVQRVLMFFGGLAGVVWVTVHDGTDRPTLLIVFAGMMGLPAFIKLDESRNTPSPPKDDDAND